MRRPSPLPPAALRDPFRSADAAALGLSPDRLRRADISHPFRGVSSALPAPTGVLDRCRAYEPVLRTGHRFSHTTALALWGAPVRSETRLHVSVAFPRSPPRAAGIHGHSLKRGDPRLVHGLPVSSAASAWVEAAALVPREELVALGDYLVTTRAATRKEIGAALGTRRVPGAPAARWALDRVRSGARSRPESLLRLALVAAGFDEPEIAHPVPVGPALVLHPDLAFPAEQVALEYEGDVHRVDRRTWHRDIERRELMESAGWRVIRVTSRDLVERPGPFLARVGAALRSRRVHS